MNQAIDTFRFSLFLLTVCVSQVWAEDGGADFKRLINIDLYDSAQESQDITPVVAPETRISGKLPPGWKDNSSWAKVDCKYEIGEDDGRRYVSVKVNRIDLGYVSLCRYLPNYTDNTLFHLKIRARGADSKVEFGIRRAGAPYTFEWSANETLNSEWKNFEYYFSLDKNHDPVGFWWNVKSAGQMDISLLQLECISETAYVNRLKALHPDNGPKNVLRTTRFPFGLQSGWMVDLQREKNNISPQQIPSNEDPRVEADSSTLGISGAPALHLVFRDKMSLWGEPFDIPVPVQPYTASLYVKGKGSGSLVILRDRKEIKRKNFEAKEEWQRESLTFDTRPGARFYNLRLEYQGELWTDAWQVNPGREPAEYRSQGDVEVALKCLAQSTSEQKIQFSEERPQAAFSVTCNPRKELDPEAVLRVRVTTLYGQSYLLPPIPLSQKEKSGNFDFLSPGVRPLGSFRLEAWVDDKNGNPLSSVQEIVIHRLHQPRYWGKDAPDSPFGVHCDADAYHVRMAKALGMNWVRSHDGGSWWSGWYFLEREPDRWTFFDEAVQRYRSENLEILACLVTTPHWAGYFEKENSKYFDLFFQPRDVAKFGNYVRTFAERYKDQITNFDVWNEPWNAAWFARSYDTKKSGRAGYLPSANPARDYLALQEEAYSVLKKINSESRVVGINTTVTTDYNKPYPDIVGRDWTDLLLQLNAQDSCDILGYHQYSTSLNGAKDDSVEKGFAVAVGPFIKKGVKKEVWMTEGSALPGYASSGFLNHTIPYHDGEDVVETANRNDRFVVSLLAAGCSKVFLYSMHLYNYFGSAANSPWLSLVSEDGSVHPSAVAFSALAYWLEDTSFKRAVDLSGGGRAYVFSNSERSVAVLAPSEEDLLKLKGAAKEGEYLVFDMFGNNYDGTDNKTDKVLFVTSSRPDDTFKVYLDRLLGDAAVSEKK